MRQLCKLPADAEPEPTLVLLDIPDNGGFYVCAERRDPALEGGVMSRAWRGLLGGAAVVFNGFQYRISSQAFTGGPMERA